MLLSGAWCAIKLNTRCLMQSRPRAPNQHIMWLPYELPPLLIWSPLCPGISSRSTSSFSRRPLIRATYLHKRKTTKLKISVSLRLLFTTDAVSITSPETSSKTFMCSLFCPRNSKILAYCPLQPYENLGCLNLECCLIVEDSRSTRYGGWDLGIWGLGEL